MAEFSNSEIYLEGGSVASRNFVEAWFKKIKLNTLKAQYFREYYRSGNVFFYRLFGHFDDNELRVLKRLYAVASSNQQNNVINDFPKNSLPLKYSLLNPADIYNYSYINSAFVYKKILSPFETQKLVNPRTEDEKKLYNALPESAKKRLEQSKKTDGIYVDLEPERLIFSFYKKQDYEPFAIPFAFPVLEDINWKLELKKIDQAVSRSVENIILLVTAGAEPDKGDINPAALKALKNLFANESLGRVLVADYTTKAQFVIPEIDKILGKEKYEVVNQDIKEGLQNILFDDGKYQNNVIKTKIFLDKLNESRECFLDDFLQIEIQKVCAAMGFQDYPIAKFKQFDMTSTETMNKTLLRLMELGILTPEVGIESLNRGELPDKEKIYEGQEEFAKKRQDGLFTPLTGGAQLYAEEDGSGSAPVPKRKNSNGRPATTAKASEDYIKKGALIEAAKLVTKFEQDSVEVMKTMKGIAKLSGSQKSLVKELCQSIIASTDKSKWNEVFVQCAKGSASSEILNVKSEILEISSKHEIPLYEASITYIASELK